MEPEALAAAAVGFMASHLSHLAQGLVARVGSETMDRLFHTVRSRLSRHDPGRDALRRLDANPAGTGEQDQLAQALAAEIRRDPALAAELIPLLAALRQPEARTVHGADMSGNVLGRGAAMAGRDIKNIRRTIGSGGLAVMAVSAGAFVLLLGLCGVLGLMFVTSGADFEAGDCVYIQRNGEGLEGTDCSASNSYRVRVVAENTQNIFAVCGGLDAYYVDTKKDVVYCMRPNT